MRHYEPLCWPRDLIGFCWVIASLLLFCLAAALPAGAAQTLTVPDDFPTIQAAIDAAEPGDTVHVRAGHYSEALVIEKPLHLEGAGRTETEIQAPDATQDVITVSIDSGGVIIEAITIRGGSLGLFGRLGKEATLEVVCTTSSENRTGIVSVGIGRLSVKLSSFINNKLVNAWLANAIAEIEDSEFLLGGMGIMLDGSVAARLSRNVIALTPRAVNPYSKACGYSDAPAAFTGTVAGIGNCIYGLHSDLCPPPPFGPWPQGFADLFWTEAIRQAVEAYERGVSLYVGEQYSQAARAYEEALRVLDRAPLPILGAYINTSLCAAYSALSRYEEALEASESARSVYAAYAMQVSVADADGNLGNVYLGLGLYEEALEAYRAAREGFVTHAMVAKVATVDMNIAGVYYSVGRYEEALAALQPARDEFVAHGTEAEVANVDGNLGRVYNALGLYDEALTALQMAREAYAATRTMVMEVAGINMNLGNVFCNLGMYEEALGAYQAAREVFVTQAMVVEAAMVDANTAGVYYSVGLYEVALEAYAQALACLDRSTPVKGMVYSLPGERWMVLANRGLCFEELSRWEEAISSYRDSIAVIESMRSFLRTEEVKLAWGERTQDVYERLIDLLYRQGQGASGFSCAERCRARTFLDLLAAGPVATLANVTGMGIGSEGVDPAVIEADLDEMIASLPAGTAAIEYFVTKDAVLVWVITQAGVKEPLRLEIRREDLASQVIAFRQALEAPPSLGNTANETLLAQSRDLYALLVQPIEDKLEGMAHVVIIPSGPLHYLPFAALLRSPGTEGHDLWSAQFEPGAYFGDRYALSYAPSLVALKYAQEAAGEASADRSLLALADPDSGDPAMTRLPEARVEAEAVAALFSTHEVYMDRDATEAVVQSQSSTVSQLLLSTHGLFNAVNPMYSYLVLAPTDGSDGRLHTYEVFGLDLHADLVVLSACETLLPHLEDMEAQVLAVKGNTEEDNGLSPELMEELTSGDEIVGLTRAFLYAGTPSVLASLWSVYSEATKDLMVAFYGYSDQGVDKAEALRQAQRDVRRLYPHPVFWAAFNLIGDWR